jgi:transposase
MATTDGGLAQWLSEAGISPERLTVQQEAILQGAWHFREQLGADYYSTRMLSHFLLHCGSGLRVAQIARLLDISRPTASKQQGLSSKEVVQAAQHRMAGRPYGKLLPRYAGPIAEFVLTHADASRYDTLAFIQRTFGVHVSTVALAKFLKKYGLDRASRAAARAQASNVPAAEAAKEPATAPAPAAAIVLPVPAEPPRPAEPVAIVPPGQPVPLPAPPFSSRTRTTRARSC